MLYLLADRQNIQFCYSSSQPYYHRVQKIINFISKPQISKPNPSSLTTKKMLRNIFRLAHSVLILQIFYYIFKQQLCPIYLVVAEVVLTLLRCGSEKKITSTRKQLQVVLSLLLGYTVFPNKFYNLSWLYFLKIIDIHQSLKQLRKTRLFSHSPSSLLTFAFDILRYTLNEYIFFWFVCIVYRHLCDSTHEPIPETHRLIYQLVVTASTIGYGDVTPRSDLQIVFFIFAIPVLCASFVVYINSLVDAFTTTFLQEEEEEPVAGK